MLDFPLHLVEEHPILELHQDALQVPRGNHSSPSGATTSGTHHFFSVIV